MAERPLPAQRRRRSPAVPELVRSAFLEALSSGWSVTHAAQAAGVHKRRLYELRDTDGEFAELWEEAVASGTEALEDEALRRAVHGNDEPVFHKGEQVGTFRRYSDVLLMFLLKKRDPSYRESARLEVSGAGGEPIQVEHDASTLRSLYGKLVAAGVVAAGAPAVAAEHPVIDAPAVRELPPGEAP